MLCYVPNCSHYTERNTCKFFRFPKDEKECKRWSKLIRRGDTEPKKSSRVCSCHFKDARKENGPSIFPWNEKKSFLFQSPEKRKRKKKIIDCAPSYNNTDTTSANHTHNEYPVSDEKDNEKSTQTTGSVMVQAENQLLLSEVKKLTTEVENLKKQPFSFRCIENQGNIIQYYTGLSKDMFLLVLNLCEQAKFQYIYGWNVVSIDLCDQVFITLMKLRLNLDYTDLGIRFNTSKHTIGNIVLTFIHVLHEILFERLMKDVPSQEKNALCLPNCFVNFRNCRMIIDCTEFFCAIPKRLDEQKRTYSNYKHRTTLKGLVGIAPNGVITYCSSLYPGSTSDKQIVKHCGVVNILKAGDLILADKGFLLEDILPQGISINIPPFLVNAQFTPAEVEKTKSIARARIHVERAIQRLKNYCILNFIPKSLYTYSSKVFQLCTALCNLQNPLLKEVENLYFSDDEAENSDKEKEASSSDEMDEEIITLFVDE